MSDRDEPGDGNLHRLDTEAADLGRDLRELFQPILTEPVPAEIARLSAELEAKLGSAAQDAAPASDRPASTVVPLRGGARDKPEE